MICAGITKAGNIITVDYVAGDGNHGAGWGDPYRLVDIYDTAVANGWANVSVQNGTNFDHYFVGYRISIISADTYFLMQEEGLMIETTEATAFYVTGSNFKANVSGSTKLNNIITSIIYNKYITFNNSATGISLIQDTIINGAIITLSFNTTLQRVMICGATYPYTDLCTLEDVIINSGNIGLYPYGNFTSAERIKIQNCIYGITCGYGSFDISNLQITGCTYDLRLRPNAAGRVVNLTDSQIDVSSIIKSAAAGNNDLTLNLLSTFKINITNGDGGTATLYDQFGNIVDTQVLAGEWEVADKVLYYKRYYEVTDGVESADDITEYFPFSLVVTKTGKQTLTVPGINIQAGEITHVRAGMIDVLEYTEALIEGTIDEENFDFEFKEEEFTFEIN